MAVPACRRMRKFARRKVRLRAKSPSCSCRVLTQPPATLSARPRSAQTLRASSVRRNAWAMVTLGGAALGKSRQPPRPLGLPFCAMRCRLRLDVPPVRPRLVSWPCAKMLRCSGASLAVRQGPEVLGSPTCGSMRPCQLVRAPRVHCALLLCAAARGYGYVRGRRPLKPPAGN